MWDLLEEEGDMMDLLDLAQLVGQPVEALVEAISLDGAGGLDVPLSISEALQSKLVSQLSSGHSVWKVLLVCEHQQNGVS